jgi:hypothetical protein
LPPTASTTATPSTPIRRSCVCSFSRGNWRVETSPRCSRPRSCCILPLLRDPSVEEQ